MLDDVVTVPLWVDLTAVGVTSAQGALVAGQEPGRDRLDFIGVIFIGLSAGLGGGLIRDLLSGAPIALVEGGTFYVTALDQGGTFYVTAALGGALVFLGVKMFANTGTASVCALVATLLLRLASLWFGWNSPKPQTLPVDLPFNRKPRPDEG